MNISTILFGLFLYLISNNLYSATFRDDNLKFNSKFIQISNLKSEYSLKSISNVQFVKKNDSTFACIPNIDYNQIDIYHINFNNSNNKNIFFKSILIEQGFDDYIILNGDFNEILYVSNDKIKNIIYARIIDNKGGTPEILEPTSFKNPIYGDKLINQFFRGKLYLTDFRFFSNSTCIFTFSELDIKSHRKKTLFEYNFYCDLNIIYPFFHNTSYLITDKFYFFFTGISEYISVINKASLTVKPFKYKTKNFSKISPIHASNYDFGSTIEYIHSNNIYVNYFIVNDSLNAPKICRILKHKNIDFSKSNIKVPPYYYSNWDLVIISPLTNEIEIKNIDKSETLSPIGTYYFENKIFINLNKKLITGELKKISTSDTLFFAYENLF